MYTKLAGILFFLFLCPAVFAADLGITVIDEALNLPLEGAGVISWDGREHICNNEGKVVITVPGDRPVRIRITYPGYESRSIIIQSGIAEYTVLMWLGGIIEERELVIEASRPNSNETVSGRSVAISGRELTQSAETGFVEDVMRAVKLLPGVGYIGGYMAMPSIRGGEPADITAVFDGFYVERPFHWGGAFSIFDPKMVESAQLSHGVFSARYGHTISGLLDIHAKTPSGDEAEIDLAVSTSAANVNLSFPLGQKAKGGFYAMGRVTYWDPFVAAAKLFVEEVKYVTTAPYIRSTALGLSYDFSSSLSFSLNGFFGSDGVGVSYEDIDGSSSIETDFLWDNKVGFFTSALKYSPREDLLIKTRLGAGFFQNDLNGKYYNVDYSSSKTENSSVYQSERTIYAQGRFDLDWEWRDGVIFSAGVEERYSRWDREQHYSRYQNNYSRPSWNLNILNQGISSSLYTILEYNFPNRKTALELGLRMDHFLLAGEDFLLKGIPAFNPRLNLDFGILEDKGIIDNLSLTLGTGLFSSVNTALQNISGRNNINEFAPTQNRSWTTVIGTKVDFMEGYSFSLEGYIKNVFNRSYSVSETDNIGSSRWNEYYFDGKAFIWGFDCMLQKMSSRYWDGWISYSYINAKYRDPKSANRTRNSGGWYYPNFHRFHTLNIIYNYKPVPAVQLTTRFSLASGIPIPKTTAIIPDPNVPGSPPPYSRIQEYSDNNRAGLVIPLDFKISFFGFNKKGKVQRELYLSFENLLSLFYKPDGPKDFDSNTGKETTGWSFVSYDLPIPLLTFGIKWSY